MNLRFVETFVWVARLQSITRTAEKLFLTQSAVSSRIAVLEAELGVELVDRRDRMFRLTRSGEKFLDHAEHLLSLQNRFKRELGSLGQTPISLRLGAIESVSHSWLIPLISWLKEQKPHLEFELNVEMTPTLHQLYRRGGLDLMFSTEAVTGKGMINEKLPPMEMVLVGQSSLKAMGKLGMEFLLSKELLTFQRNSQPHLALSHALDSHGVTDKRLHSVSSISALVKLVESGFGIATLPRAAVDSLASRHDIAALDTVLKLKPLPVVASYLNLPANSELEETISAALRFAKASMQTAGKSRPDSQALVAPKDGLSET